MFQAPERCSTALNAVSGGWWTLAGVTWDQKLARWSVDVRVGGRYVHIANFKDEINAAEEYDKYVP